MSIAAGVQIQKVVGSRVLALAGMLWPVYLLTCLAILVVGLPEVYAARLEPCYGDNCYRFQLNPEEIQQLKESGVSLETHARYSTLLSLIDTLAIFTIGGILYWKKRDSWLAMLLAFIAISHGVNVTGSVQAVNELYPWAWPVTRIIPTIVGTANIIFWSMFPDGKFLPRWTRGLVPVALLAGVVIYFEALHQPGSFGAWFLQIYIYFWLLGAMAFQVYRFRRTTDPIARQQLKWFMTGILMFVPAVVVMSLLGLAYPEEMGPGTLGYALSSMVYFVGITSVFVGLLVAILRYRLFDVDVVIRRTLIYTILTVLLGLFYLGSVVLLQSLFSIWGIEQSQAAVVLSTLGIAALFTPLRRRVQETIDRRFYRRKYNAARTLEAFAAQARNVVELEQLLVNLTQTVQETVQPEAVGVWLRSTPWARPGGRRSQRPVD